MIDAPTHMNGEHYYLSTACFHGLHSYCEAMTGMQGIKRPAQCKFCPAGCVCQCHRIAALTAQLTERLRVDEANTGE